MLMNAIRTHALQMAFATILSEDTSVLAEQGKNMARKAIHATLTPT